MNTKNIVKYLIATLFIGYVVPALAQQPDNLNKEVQVTRAYDPIISDANKIDIQVTKDDSLTSIKKEFQYSVLSRNVSSTYAIRPIPGATITEKAYTDPHFFYARLGIGYPLSPLADLYINNIKPSTLSVGGYYNFRSIFGNIKNENPNGHNIPIDEYQHNIGAYLRKHFESATLGVEGGFNQHKVLFYGFDNGINHLINYQPNKDSLSQTYNAFNIKANITSNNKEAEGLRYNANLRINSFGDRGKSLFDIGRNVAMTENTYGGELYLGKLLNEVHLLNVNVDFNYFNRKLTHNPTSAINDSTENRYHMVALPYYQLINDNFELLAGVKFDLAKERDTTKLYIRPHIQFAYLASNEIVPYAAIDGGRDVNTYEKIVRENPYILPGMNFDMVSTFNDYKFTVGAKGNIQKTFSYNIYASYALLKNMYFFYNTNNLLYPQSAYSLYNNFNVALDEVQQFNVGLEAAASFNGVNAMLKANYYNFSLNDVKAPFHRPNFTAEFNANATIAQYFIVSARVYGQGKVAVGYYAPQNTTLYNDGFVDVGLGGEYLFNRNFSVFANINNLLNKKYMVWNLYKVPGIHVEGGITLKF